MNAQWMENTFTPIFPVKVNWSRQWLDFGILDVKFGKIILFLT